MSSCKPVCSDVFLRAVYTTRQACAQGWRVNSMPICYPHGLHILLLPPPRNSLFHSMQHPLHVLHWKSQDLEILWSDLIESWLIVNLEELVRGSLETRYKHPPNISHKHRGATSELSLKSTAIFILLTNGCHCGGCPGPWGWQSLFRTMQQEPRGAWSLGHLVELCCEPGELQAFSVSDADYISWWVLWRK